MQPHPKAYRYRQLVQAKLFIDGHYSEAIDLKRISGSACFSRFHFLRLFKTIYGKTPNQYLMAVRLEKAKALLADGYTITDACYAIGFASASSFTGLFKKTFGCTPSQFQLRQNTLKAACQKMPLKFVPGCFAQTNGWTKSNFGEVIC